MSESKVFSATEVKTFAEDLEAGGAWKDEDLGALPDEWSGDKGSEQASVDRDVVHVPKTTRTVEREILTEAAITQDVLNIITARVESALLKSTGTSETSLLQLIDKQMQSHRQSVTNWMTSANSKFVAIEKLAQDRDTNQISKLDERLAQLELRIDTLVGAMTKHGAEEARMIHEAHKIIMDRKASEDEGQEVSEPSIYHRMDARMNELNNQLASLEPYADQGAAAQVTVAKQSANVRRKFGRLM